MVLDVDSTKRPSDRSRVEVVALLFAQRANPIIEVAAQVGVFASRVIVLVADSVGVAVFSSDVRQLPLKPQRM